MISEHHQAGGLVCEWSRLSLSLDLSSPTLSLQDQSTARSWPKSGRGSELKSRRRWCF